MQIMAQLIRKTGRRIYNKCYPNHRGCHVKQDYLGMPISTEEEGNSILSRLVTEGKPFMATRLGHTELSCITNYMEIQELKNTSYIHKIMEQIKGKAISWEASVVDAMHRMSGVYPSTPEMLEKFVQLYLKELANVDVIGIWYNYYEDVVCKQYCPQATLVPLKSLEPYYFKNPWSQHLKGKKVLVIHPFEASIRKQFLVKDFLFEDKNILPDFDLITIKAFQTAMYLTAEYANWFDALDALKDKISKTGFDIAIIGAGAYGLPLASFIKQIGKQSIHMGGATQILFGIKGNRWDRHPGISKLYNSYWTRPLAAETPENNKIMEGGSYW
jgi:hypothetical protein